MKLSIVTPSFNQAPFLEACLKSVADQETPAIEHLVYDPGSKDGSLEIASQAEGITLINEPDEGQADAVSKGFLRAKGDILGWLNSDDAYASPQVFTQILERFAQEDTPDIVYGDGIYVDAEDKKLRDAYVNTKPETLPVRLATELGILQPGLFLRKSVIEKIGILDKDLNFCLDYEFWVRAVKAGLKFAYVPIQVAKARYYPDNKTMGQRGNSYLETCKMVKRHFGFTSIEWLGRYAEYLVLGHDGILKSGSPSEEDKQQAILKEKVRLVRAFNCDQETITFLAKNRNKAPYKRTVDFMTQNGIELKPPAKNIPLNQKTEPNCVCYTVDKNRWAFSRKWKEATTARSAAEFERIRKRKKHDVCVIVGNGPSLNKCDFDLLANADVFISNYAFLKPELMQHATYLAVANNLVAEQGSEDFNLLQGVRKFFPYWLHYCLDESDNSFFVNSVGYEQFSTKIEDNISWRSTVTFFHLQLAYGLDYQKVIMVGFDHNYTQEESAVEGDELDCKEDDINHFDPNYFKNKKWHAADVDKMEKVYKLAKEAYEADGREIVNCTAGGQLEVFRRGELEQEIKNLPSKRLAKAGPGKVGTKILIIDQTLLGGETATGQVKDSLFKNVPTSQLMQVYHLSGSRMGIWANGRYGQAEGVPLVDHKVWEYILHFKPDVIYFRPTDTALKVMDFGIEVIKETKLPYVFHIMDDWPLKNKALDIELYSQYEDRLKKIIDGAHSCLSIGDEMSQHFAKRYGREFVAVANGVDLENWCPPQSPRDPEIPFRICYNGGLASNMTLHCVTQIAHAVIELSKRIPIKFFIYTMPHWRVTADEVLPKHSSIIVKNISGTEDIYRKRISHSDLLLIAYNFDEDSRYYVRHSIANKLPDIIASGQPLLVIGPEDYATIKLAQKIDGVNVLTESSVEAITAKIEEIQQQPEKFLRRAIFARKTAEKILNISTSRKKLESALASAAYASSSKKALPFPHGSNVLLREASILGNILKKNTSNGVMLDIGSKNGKEFKSVLGRNWQVHAFEPTPYYYDKLASTINEAEGITLDSRAVSNKTAPDTAFYINDRHPGNNSLKIPKGKIDECARINTVSISAYVKEKDIKKIELLNINANGYEKQILDGIPWHTIQPENIILEFNNHLKKMYGYDVGDLVSLLKDKGYHILLSEWHRKPSTNEKSCWRQLIEEPTKLRDKLSSGKLIACKSKSLLTNFQSTLDDTVFKHLGIVQHQVNARKAQPSNQSSPIGRNSSVTNDASAKLKQLELMIHNRDIAILEQKEKYSKEHVKVLNRDKAIIDLKAKLTAQEHDYQALKKELGALKQRLKK